MLDLLGLGTTLAPPSDGDGFEHRVQRAHGEMPAQEWQARAHQAPAESPEQIFEIDGAEGLADQPVTDLLNRGLGGCPDEGGGH